MKKSVMSVAVAAALLSMTAHASEFDGLFLGGKLGANNSSISGTGTAASPTAGSRVTGTFGIEEGYNWDMGGFLLGADFFVDMNQKTSHAMTPATAMANYGSSSLGLDLKLGLPSGHWMPYAKMGWDRTTGTVAYTNASFKYTNHLHLGAGVEYKFNPNWSVAVEWTRTGSKATAATLTNDNFTVGLNYYFGSAPAPAPMVVAPAVIAPVVAPAVVKKEEPVVTPAAKKEAAPVYKTIFSDKPVTIEGTSFDTGSAKLKRTANKQLDQVVDFAAKNKDANLTVTGYTDNRGSVKLNDKLSAKRAASVKAYLVKKGVAANRITAEGKGMSNPVADNKTAAGRAKNRRVEINSVVKEEKKVQVK